MIMLSVVARSLPQSHDPYRAMHHVLPEYHFVVPHQMKINSSNKKMKSKLGTCRLRQQSICCGGLRHVVLATTVITVIRLCCLQCVTTMS